MSPKLLDQVLAKVNLTEFAAKYALPYAPTRGGVETMYPEYMDKVKAMPIPKAPASR